MTDFPNTGAPLWGAGQVSPWATQNEAGFIWDAFASRSIIEDRDLTAPPGACANGARYLIKATATGVWAGHNNELAIALGTNAANGWYFVVVARYGNQLFVRDEDLLIEYDGAAWVTAPGGVSSMNDLTDVVETAPANNDMLRHNGSNYVNDLKRSTDGTLAGNSDTNIPSEKAVRTAIAAAIAGLSWKQAVRAATAVAGTLASDFENGDTVDGVVLATGNRILIKNQAAPAENGIYTVNVSGAPTRATDADSGTELVNASVFVSEGSTNADTQWTCTTNAAITVGTTGLTFAQFISSSYNDEAARDAVGAALTDNGLAVVTVNDGADTIDINVPAAAGSDFRTKTDATKALTSDAVWDAAAAVALTDGATVTPNFAAGINFNWTIGGNRTLANPSNIVPGQTGCIEITQDGTGSRTIAYGTDYRFAGGTDIVLSTAGGSIDLLFYYVTAGSKIFLSAQKAIAA